MQVQCPDLVSRGLLLEFVRSIDTKVDFSWLSFFRWNISTGRLFLLHFRTPSLERPVKDFVGQGTESILHTSKSRETPHSSAHVLKTTTTFWIKYPEKILRRPEPGTKTILFTGHWMYGCRVMFCSGLWYATQSRQIMEHCNPLQWLSREMSFMAIQQLLVMCFGVDHLTVHEKPYLFREKNYRYIPAAKIRIWILQIHQSLIEITLLSLIC